MFSIVESVGGDDDDAESDVLHAGYDITAVRLDAPEGPTNKLQGLQPAHIVGLRTLSKPTGCMSNDAFGSSPAASHGDSVA